MACLPGMKALLASLEQTSARPWPVGQAPPDLLLAPSPAFPCSDCADMLAFRHGLLDSREGPWEVMTPRSSRPGGIALLSGAHLNNLFAMNRRLMKAYLLKESLDRLWTYHYEGAMLRYLQSWIDQLRWQRLAPFQKLARMLLEHLEGILNYCRAKVPMGVVEAINGNLKTLLRRGRGYKNLRYLSLKAQRMAVTRTEFVVFQKAA
jgi:hypothetical protein